ncbi:symplekin tight junction carboxy-terminal protein, putative [Babesia ovata]|uniref:Symplekin tight junction carboxy-terminal protein, putative n=1 Tax=Babesia ovata TaxID=189622 RepID=A0A2H6KFK4_9APIC|nr:symplekin tight junction carboxy-terminal protein, putative [Babesia ovata]GBE61764.1 symplekin tight junction carboxy-terminal protein, putative [Babesia ovata]
MSQEAEILHLLRIGRRDAFEARLQQFRRLQLTQSKAGKGKLCRLINHVVHSDGQYATVLIEDISNLLNDADPIVRIDALAAFASSAHLFMFHVLLARAVHPSSQTARDAVADLACALSLVKRAAVDMDASDCRGKNGLASVTELVHSGTRSPVANALRVVMMELAILAQLGVSPAKSARASPRPATSEAKESDMPQPEVSREAGANHRNKEEAKGRTNRRFDSDDWQCVVRDDAELMAQITPWSASATRLLAGCMCAATKSNKPGTLARSLIAAEAVSTLVSHYPYQYFHALMPALIATHTHMFRTVGAYESMILRVFTSQEAQPFHTQLVAMLKEAGYNCELTDMYKRAHITASGNKCYVHDAEADVKEDDAINVVALIAETGDAEARFQLATKKLENRLEDEMLKGYKAAQVFECSALAIKHVNNTDGGFNCANAQMRVGPPMPPADEPTFDLDCTPNPKYTMPSSIAPIRPTPCETIREHHRLYSLLLATQMMDTAVSYTWHLRAAVALGNRRDRFDAFNRALLNRLFVSGTLPKETQRNLLDALLDHMAQMVMINHKLGDTAQERQASRQKIVMADSSLTDAQNMGVKELMTYVASSHQSALLEQLLDSVSQLLLTKACIELAKGVVRGNKDEVIRELNEVNATDPADQPTGTEVQDAAAVGRLGYGELVEVVISKLYVPWILEVVEIRDAYVLQICKFILNMPFIPLSLVKLISGWLLDPTSRRLAFSLISNILKKSQCPDLKQRVLELFLRSIVSEDAEIRNLFLKLVSSPKGLYRVNTEGRRYSVAASEAAHDALVEWTRSGGGCSKCNIGPYLSKEVIEECNAMAERPIWQWNKGLITEISGAHRSVGTRTSAKCKGCEWQELYNQVNKTPEVDTQLAIEWPLLPSVWLEELFALMAMPDAVKAHPFLVEMLGAVAREESDVDMVEPVIVAAGKNAALVPFVCQIADKFDEETTAKARRNCCPHVAEIVRVLRHEPQMNAFLVTLLGEVRAMWLDPKYNLVESWQRESSPTKQLVEVALSHLDMCEEYVLQLTPFLGVEQLETVVTHLFTNSTEENLQRCLTLLLEVPTTFRKEQKELNLALPQHFMYHCYSIKPYKELLKRQTGLLDLCVEYCVTGQMSVESALSACTLIVESPEDVSFVFGRLLCQLVQKVPQTRSVVVQAILPALFKRCAWEDKMLWRGVVICMTSLWPGHKEQLCRLILLLPQQQGEATIKTLQTQHNIIAFMESTLPQLDHTVHIPAYIKTMLSL